MSTLQRLKPDGARLATPELASGQLERWDEDAWRDVVEPFERPVPLARLNEGLDALLERTQPHLASLDIEAAPLVHQLLPLSRREASDAAVWRWLAIIHRPDVVRHRWENVSWSTMRTRFLRPGTRPDSNVFARWWWIAELSRDGGDYGLTQRLLRRQAVANAIFVRGLSAHRPAVSACLEVLEDVEAGELERVMLELSRVLATVPVEALDQAALQAELSRILAPRG